jgi:hypothetical protein
MIAYNKESSGTWTKCRKIVVKLINIIVLIILGFFIFWLGLKGILGFFLGVGLTGYLIFSKNIFLMGLVKLLKGDFNAGELFR